MSSVTIEKVSLNIPKFKEVRGALSLEQYAEKTGFKPDMLSKIERGERWTTLKRFAELCQKTNREPNDFFEIVKKIS
jgi:transcriptional regulator with XRE-family HTH domain